MTPPPTLDVSVVLRDDAAVIRVRGEVDIANAELLAASVDEACAADRPAVVFDVAEMTYCDSSTIRVLSNAVKRCVAANIRMSVIGAHGAVRRVLEIAGVTEIFNVEDN